MLKEFLEYQKTHKKTNEEVELEKEWKKRTKHVCKPCWELKYCPYGPLVEQFPLPPITREEAIKHNDFLKNQLKNGKYKGWRKKTFKKEVEEFDPNLYQEKIDKEILERGCNVFGHICPVFFVNEPFTETKETRRINRKISRETMLRVVRRDNYICQKCGKHLKDNEIEFDHIIPYTKGGSSDENNIQLTCIDCNRKKSKKLPDFIDK